MANSSRNRASRRCVRFFFEGVWQRKRGIFGRGIVCRRVNLDKWIQSLKKVRSGTALGFAEPESKEFGNLGSLDWKAQILLILARAVFETYPGAREEGLGKFGASYTWYLAKKF